MYNPKIGENVWCLLYDDYDGEVFNGEVTEIVFEDEDERYPLYVVQGFYEIYESEIPDEICVNDIAVFRTKKDLLVQKLDDSNSERDRLNDRIRLIENEIRFLQSKIDSE